MKRYNAIAIYAAIMVCSLLADGCQKEYGIVPEGALRLSAEGFNGDKMVVDNAAVAWVEGDELKINGDPYTVIISEGHAYTSTDVAVANNYYAYYPSDLDVRAQQTSQQTSTQSYAIYLPNTYSSSYDNGRQVIKLPMVACAGAGSTGLNFKHITSAILVTIKNSTGYDVFLDRVVVKSETQRLNSSNGGMVLTADFQNNNISVAAETTSVSDEKYVVVTFGNEEVNIRNGDTKKVQVPILPISAEDDDLTIEVYTHSKLHSVITGLEGTLNTNYDFIYSKRAAAPALARNEICKANIEITRQSVNGNTTEVDHSLFGVAENTKVRFSQGNLQFSIPQSVRTASTDAIGTWRFADKQYDYIGALNANISETYPDWIDLFGWGTSGWDSRPPEGYTDEIFYQPWSISQTASKYCPAGRHDVSLTDGYADADWAYHNAISNGGNVVHKWRTMTSSEWEYLIHATNHNQASGRPDAANKRGLGKVNGVCGMILLPDSWTLPSGCTFTPSSNSWEHNVYDSDRWEAMEAAGAVFLPAAGMREMREGRIIINENIVYYWSVTHYADFFARGVVINNINNNFRWATVAGSYISRCNGCSVRPVQDNH